MYIYLSLCVCVYKSLNSKAICSHSPPVSFLIHQQNRNNTATTELGYLGLSHTVTWHCHLSGWPFF